MSQGPSPQGEFPQDLTWRTLNALMTEQLAGVDVQAISEKDFNEGGDIIMTPPSVRTFYGVSGYSSTTDSQRLSYEVVGRFILLCADQNLSQDVVDQAYDSLALAKRAARILAGTRIILPTGERSEPITLMAIEPVPVAGVGTAYGVAIEVPGLAQFDGANAAGYTAVGVSA